MKQYHNLLTKILDEGQFRSKEEERTGTGTKGIFGHQYRCKNVAEQFPLVTTKKVHFKSIVTELLWKISGSTNIRPLVLAGNRIWNEWPYQNYLDKTGRSKTIEKYSDQWYEQMKVFSGWIKEYPKFAEQWGDLGPTYGHHMRNFTGYDSSNREYVKGFDQLVEVINTIKGNPGSRRIIMSLWNATENPYTLLPPCPCFYHFAVLGGKLHLQMYQRSCDTFLGVPFNTAQDSLLLLMVAHVCGLPAGDFIHSFGDAHIYANHMEQVIVQLSREPRSLPQVKLNPDITNLFDFTVDDIELVNYKPHPAIKAKVAV